MNKKNTIKSLSVALLLLLSLPGKGQVKILFDATKAEMAGNADWVVDADLHNVGVGSSGAYTSGTATKSNPQQIPTPAQSGITASTSESYWFGGLSAWGVDCAKRGYTVETLPWNGQITYGNTSNAQDLSHYKVFVIDEPNLVFSTAEKTALMQFVQNGGGLFMISDHTVSDRNGDGWDSPAIWNDFLTTNSVQPNPFGFSFDLVDFSQTTTNIVSSDPVVNGPMGLPTKAQWSGGTTMTLNPTLNSTVTGVVYKTGSTLGGTTNAMVVYAKYGSGKVAAMGDSSPADDGTGNPDCTLYPGYFGDASGQHQLLIMNLTIWLAQSASAVEEVNGGGHTINVYPNPSTGNINVSTDNLLSHSAITIYNFTGQLVAQNFIGEFNKGDKAVFTLAPGMYVVKVSSDKGIQTSRFTVY